MGLSIVLTCYRNHPVQDVLFSVEVDKFRPVTLNTPLPNSSLVRYWNAVVSIIT